MPFIEAWKHAGKIVADHHSGAAIRSEIHPSGQSGRDISRLPVNEQRAALARADAEAAQPGAQLIKEALSGRIRPEHIDWHIETTRRGIEKSRADAADTRYSSSYRATARENVRSQTRRLEKLNELKASIPAELAKRGITTSTMPAPPGRSR